MKLARLSVPRETPDRRKRRQSVYGLTPGTQHLQCASGGVWTRAGRRAPRPVGLSPAAPAPRGVSLSRPSKVHRGTAASASTGVIRAVQNDVRTHALAPRPRHLHTATSIVVPVDRPRRRDRSLVADGRALRNYVELHMRAMAHSERSAAQRHVRSSATARPVGVCREGSGTAMHAAAARAGGRRRHPSSSPVGPHSLAAAATAAKPAAAGLDASPAPVTW